MEKCCRLIKKFRISYNFSSRVNIRLQRSAKGCIAISWQAVLSGRDVVSYLLDRDFWIGESYFTSQRTQKIEYYYWSLKATCAKNRISTAMKNKSLKKLFLRSLSGRATFQADKRNVDSCRFKMHFTNDCFFSIFLKQRNNHWKKLADTLGCSGLQNVRFSAFPVDKSMTTRRYLGSIGQIIKDKQNQVLQSLCCFFVQLFKII